MAKNMRVDGKLDFGSTTTFHGPNHSYEAKAKPEKAIWIVLFVVGLALAVYQCGMLLREYYTGEENMIQVTKTADYSDEKYQDLPLTICRKKWINWDVVKQRGVPVRVLLFAFSLIPSLQKHVLDDMLQKLGDIQEEDKIWGIPFSNCSQDGLLRKRRFFGDLGKSLKDAGETVIGGGEKLINDVGKTITETGEAIVSGTKTVVEEFASLGGDFANLIQDLGSILGDGFTGTFLKFSDLIAPLFDVGQLLGGGYTSEQKAKIARAIEAFLAKRLCSCKINFEKMLDWKSNAEYFEAYMKSNGHETLNHFFASIAFGKNDVYAESNALEHIGWRFFDGNFCEMVTYRIDTGEKKRSLGERIEMQLSTRLSENMADYLEKSYERSDNALALVLPYAAESSLDKNANFEEVPEQFLQHTKESFEPARLIGKMFLGHVPSFGLAFRKMTHIQGISGQCREAPEKRWYPKGYGQKVCERKCRLEVERRNVESDFGCRLVTMNTGSEIQVQGQLICPGSLGQFSRDENRTAAEMVAAVDACIEREECSSQQFCDEWEVEMSVVENALEPKLENGKCDIQTEMSTLRIVIELPEVQVSKKKARYHWVDVIGIVGGIFGLYVGASILTFVHAIVHVVRKMIEMKKGMVKPR